MKLLVCGARSWTNYSKIYNAIRKLNPEIVIEGACSGADSLAGKAAEELGLKVLRFSANWKMYGRAAGPIRNSQMLKEGNPDIVVACHNNISSSKGTKDMVKRSLIAGKPVYLINDFVEGMRKLSLEDLEERKEDA